MQNVIFKNDLLLDPIYFKWCPAKVLSNAQEKKKDSFV